MFSRRLRASRVDPDQAKHRVRVRSKQWIESVRMQHRRAIGPFISDATNPAYREEWYRRPRDVEFYVFSLHLFVKSVELAQLKVPGGKALKPALKAFHQRVPGLQELRDAIEHFEDYDFGIGKKQPAPTAPSLTYSYSETDAGMSYGHHSIHVTTGTAASEDLYRALSGFVGEVTD